jgi:hypothetical protein
MVTKALGGFGGKKLTLVWLFVLSFLGLGMVVGAAGNSHHRNRNLRAATRCKLILQGTWPGVGFPLAPIIGFLEYCICVIVLNNEPS